MQWPQKNRSLNTRCRRTVTWSCFSDKYILHWWTILHCFKTILCIYLVSLPFLLNCLSICFVPVHRCVCACLSCMWAATLVGCYRPNWFEFFTFHEVYSTLKPPSHFNGEFVSGRAARHSCVHGEEEKKCSFQMWKLRLLPKEPSTKHRQYVCNNYLYRIYY